MKICIIGHYPPPFGGESAEVEGLAASLRKNHHYCKIINIGPSRSVSSQDYISPEGYIDYYKKVVASSKDGFLLHKLQQRFFAPQIEEMKYQSEAQLYMKTAVGA